MYLLGSGSAFPSVTVSEETLATLGASYSDSERRLLERVGVTTRAISLPVDMLRTCGCSDIVDTRKVATVSPTTLGVEAAKNALMRAGISIEQVGLVVADCGTPYQTCPSEAQRIAGAFGVKIPAYDLSGGPAAVPMFFNIISSWREDRVPEYVLCVSTNTPSLHVAYGSDRVSAGVFGDAACAFVISRKHRGAWRVVSTSASTDSVRRTPVVVERRISLNPQALPSKESLRESMSVLFSDSELSGYSYVVGPGVVANDFASLLRERGVSTERIASVVSDKGYSLGSAMGAALVDICDRASKGESVALVHCGDGLSAKVVLLRD